MPTTTKLNVQISRQEETQGFKKGECESNKKQSQKL